VAVAEVEEKGADIMDVLLDGRIMDLGDAEISWEDIELGERVGAGAFLAFLRLTALCSASGQVRTLTCTAIGFLLLFTVRGFSLGSASAQVRTLPPSFSVP